MYVQSSSDLLELCEAAREAGLFGLDLEFIRERSYYPQLALVQLAVGEDLVIVDPLGPVDLAPLEALILDENVTKVLHAATQDLEIFYHRTKELPRRLFDTQIAAALLGMGNQISYGGLVERVLGVSLTKGESFTDWLQRPLSQKQESYALDDVRYLLPLHEALWSQLADKGRERWLEEECLRYEGTRLYIVDEERLFLKVRRSNSLNGGALAVLQELALWREDEARRRDRPRRSVVSDEVLVEMARTGPRNDNDLGRFRGLHPRERQRSGSALLDAVRRGRERPPIAPPKRPRNRLSPEAETTVEFLQACTKALCYRAEIAPVLVANNADIEALVLEHCNDGIDAQRHPLLTGWRRELVGERLLAVLAGDVAVRLDPETGVPTFED